MAQRRFSGVYVLSILFICIPLAQSPALTPSAQAESQRDAAFALSESQVITVVDSLVGEGRVDEALIELEKARQRYPNSIALVRKQYDVLWSSKRFEECLQLLNDVYPNVPAGVQQLILQGKRFVLFELVKEAVKSGDTQKALDRLEELADAGYRGVYDLGHDEAFKPLWTQPRYKEIQKVIAENAGIGGPSHDFTATTINGERFSLSAQKGKVVLIDFWSTFCVPCKKELPNLRSLYGALSKDGFEIVSISLDTDAKLLKKFLAANPMPWKKVFSGNGFDDEIAKLYDVSWVPSYWLIDKRGILRYYDVRGEDLRSAVRSLINEN
jgi:peroxiredoxin